MAYAKSFLTLAPEWGRTSTDMMRKLLIGCAGCLVLCQCNTLQSDCEALRQREAEISVEPRGDFYVGRRYYVPLTRFWGYVREPGQSWRHARLVIMDESVVHTPDRGYEPPVAGASFGKDQNVEYILKGRYTGEKAYDPSTDQVLPVFKAVSYTVRNATPGFLFVPSEEYDEEMVTLQPGIMPTPQQCAAAVP